MNTHHGVEVIGQPQPGQERVLTPEAVEFLAGLHREFNAERKRLLAARVGRQKRIDASNLPDQEERFAMAALDSPGCWLASSAGLRALTWICMSMRSSSGPDRRAW